MPKDRWTLNASMKAANAKLTKRMIAAGADLAPPEPEMDCIRIYVDPTLGAVRSWSHATVFSLAVRILGVAPKTVIQGFRLTSPGWDLDAYVLEDPAGGSSPRDFYRMLDRSRYQRLEAVNHRLGPEGILRRGDTIEGSLLAECMTAAPARYSRTEWIPLSLSIVNPFEEVQTISFEMPVERIPNPIQRRASREPLFQESLAESVGKGASPVDARGEEGAEKFVQNVRDQRDGRQDHRK
jgi:hypothetical protein